MKNYLLLLFAVLLCVNVMAQNNLKKYTYDEAAVFPGNNNDFVAYIAEHVKKPEVIINNVKGRLVINVDVDPTGKASILNIRRVSPEIDTEFVKAILAAPTWAPAKLRGKRVSHLQSLYFDVELNKEKSTMTVNALNAKPKEIQKDQIYTAVEIEPSFPGGFDKFQRFADDNIRYPAQAKAAHVMGRVYLNFIVEIDGSLSDIKIVRDPGSGLGEEAIRVMKLSPKWNPGQQNGTTVRVSYVMPINFSQ